MEKVVGEVAADPVWLNEREETSPRGEKLA